jgi:hypothetical protein
MWYNCLTFIGILFGYLLRCDHDYCPFDEYIIITWGILSIFGLVFTDLTPLFYFMTMVSMGWGMREVTIYY